MKHGNEVKLFEVLANTDTAGLDGCVGGNCPTVYATAEGDLLVQGYTADDLFEGSFIPDGESVVRIPAGLIRQLVERNSL